MTAPSPSTDLVLVSGTWRNIHTGQAPTGVLRVTVLSRVVSVTDEVIFPAGTVFEVTLDDTGYASFLSPATDDPDNLPTNWKLRVEERFEGYPVVTYTIAPLMSQIGTGLNLRTVSADEQVTVPPSLVLGGAGGVALLDTDGDVVNANGDKVALAQAASSERRRVGVMGHSIASGGNIPNLISGERASGMATYDGYSYLAAALPRTGGRYVFGGIYATPGATSAQVIANHLSAVLDSDDDIVLVDMLANDIGAANWPATKANYQLVIDSLLSAGKTPVILTGWPYGAKVDTGSTTINSAVVNDSTISALDTGRTVTATSAIPPGCYVSSVVPGVSFRLSSSRTSQVDVLATATTTGLQLTIGAITPAQLAFMYSFIEWARNLAATNPSVFVADTFAQTVDPASATANWLGGRTTDGVHPAPAGIQNAAPALAACLNSIPGATPVVLGSGYNPTAKFPDSTFSVGAGSWTLAGGGSFRYRPATTPATWLGGRLEISSTATFNEAVVANLGTLTPGHRMRVAFRLDALSVASNWTAAIYDTVSLRFLCGYFGVITQMPDSIVVWEFTVPDSIGSNPFAFTLSAAAGGVTTLSIAQLTVTDLTAANAL